MSLLGLRRDSVVDLARVRAAVAEVPDPEIGLSLGDLDMVGDVDVDRRGQVTVSVRLTTSNCPLVDELREAVTATAAAVGGVAGTHVDFQVMDEQQRAAVGARLHATKRAPSSGLGGGPRVYAVASGKGGVGKSTVTANVAAALASEGKRVGVLDGDVWGYSMPQLFGVRRAPVAFDGIMLPVVAHGVALMSIGFFVTDEQPVAWRGPMLHKALQQFVSDVYWGDLDVLLVDLPPGTGDVTLSVLELLPDAGLVAVTTPQQAARSVASRVGKLAKEAGMPIAGVVENMSAAVCACCGASSAVFGSGGGAQLADELAAPLVGQVPLSVELREAGDRGEPVVLDAPDAVPAVELRRVAAQLPVVRRDIVRRSLPLSVT